VRRGDIIRWPDQTQAWGVVFAACARRHGRTPAWVCGRDLSDLPLDQLVADFESRDAVAGFASVRSSQSFHLVSADDHGLVTRIAPMSGDGVLINGGFFTFRPQIFDYIREGEELVEEPFQRLMSERKLIAYRHLGFWQAMDTFKDKITLDRMEARGDCPWMLWRTSPA